MRTAIFFTTIFAIIVGYYLPHFARPAFGDEVVTFLLPTLKLMQNWHALLPWHYGPAQFYGHPPFFYVLHAFVLTLFPFGLITLRVFSLLLSCLSLFALYEIDKSERPVLIFLGHFLFWHMANSFLADTLFVTLFLFFTWSLLSLRYRQSVFFGVLMVLTRETSVIVFFALWIQGLFDFKFKHESSRFKLASFLLMLQLAWFLSLYFTQGSIMPVYNNEGFILDAAFFLNTLSSIFDRVYLASWWVVWPLLLAGLFYWDYKKQRLHPWKEHFFLLLIPLFNLFSLSLVTTSFSHYQYYAVASLAVFLALLMEGRSKKIQIAFYVVLCLLIARNLWQGHLQANHYLNRPKSTDPQLIYACAKKMHALAPLGKKGIVRPWLMGELAENMTSLETMVWHDPSWKFQAAGMAKLGADPIDFDFDFYAYLQEPDHPAFEFFEASYQRVLSSERFKVVSQNHDVDGCHILKRVQ